MNHVLIFCMIAAIGVLAGVDTVQQGELGLAGYVVPLAILGPLFSFWCLRRQSWKPARLVYIFIVTIGLAGYSFYVLSNLFALDRSSPINKFLYELHVSTLLFAVEYFLFSVGLSLGFSAVQVKLSLRNPN